MELKVLWRTLVRRWYFTLAILMIASVATAAVVRWVGPTYKAEGSVLVFPPVEAKGSSDSIDGNPFLQLAGVTQARDVVIRTLMSNTVRSDWEASFPGADYAAVPDFTNSAPIILLTVEGLSPAEVPTALVDLAGRVPQILAELQDELGLNTTQTITSMILTEDTNATTVRKSQIRAAILAAGVTLGLGMLFLALLESLLAARTRRRASPDAESDAGAPLARTAPPNERAGPRPGKPVRSTAPTGTPSKHRPEKSSNQLNDRAPREVVTSGSARSRTGGLDG